MTAANLVIVEDRPLVQQRLHDLFATNPEFVLRALCTNAEDALERLHEVPCDLLLVDLELPGMHGEDLIVAVRARFPQIKIVVFTVFEEPGRIVRLVESGINGYLLKDTNDELLLAELRVILLGGASLSPRVARKILDSTEDNEKLQDCPLSARELEILHLLALGLNYRSIAEDLGVSPNTVRVHIARIYEKLESSNKIQALNRARQLRLLD